ncbi:helix-turn-helix transcriptional regulator [Haloarcula pelagica]|uniref:helix-turn-helix transcriptional regulator n=1 Tax=Haloarcula pelagica TaxID=3033389 RepID=UPI0024C42D1B|nr:hypothetical protein [Halomicroarcula sp. YJ-61-S]
MSLRLSGSLFALLLASLLLAPAATAMATSAAPTAPQQSTPTATDGAVSEAATIELQLRPDGDARWTVTQTYALESSTEVETFRSLGEDYVAGETGTGQLAAFRAANQEAIEATGRQMNITDIDRAYDVDGNRGTLTLSFTWTDFAVTESDRLVIDDAFNTTDGTWFRSLGENDTFIISPPTGYGVDSAPIGVENGRLRFEGPRTFEPGTLRIVYTGDQATPTPTPTATPEQPFAGGVPLWFGVAVIVVGVVAVVGYMTRQGSAGEPAAPTESGPDDGGSGAAAASADETEEPTEEIDTELLSDEERVERLLEQNGGRMKQARIVKETGWSNAKVSQLLSSMDEDDRIDKLRIGRENLISFPDEDITDFDE